MPIRELYSICYKHPYEDPKYEAYYPGYVKNKLLKYENDRIEIIEDYMGNDAEFTVYFYV